MAEICSKCGKSAELDSAGKCFRCAEVEGKKYTSKKFVIPNEMLYLLSVVGMIINVAMAYNFVTEEMHFRFFPRWTFAITYAAFWVCVIKLAWEKIYYMWSFPIFVTIMNLIIMIIIPETLRPDFGQRLKIEILFPVILWVGLALSFLARFSRANSYNILNYVLDGEKKLSKQLSQIPTYYGGFTQEEYNQHFYYEQNRAMELLEELDIDEADKEKTRHLLQNREEQKSDVGGKYGYLSVINSLMKESFKVGEKGVFINEISADKSREILPVNNQKTINGYVTEKYFNLYNRVETELNAPFDYFLSRSKELRTNEWFKNFKSEYSTIKSGYVGESRVEKSLKKYEDQMIVLPNVRIEVDGESSEMDFIVISPYGVYSLEVKNLAEKGAYDILIEKDGRWSKVVGDYEEPMKSPDTQNERHIVHLETMINRALGRSLDEYIRVKGMIVIANDKVNITNNNDACIVKRYDYVMQSIRQNNIVLKESDMKQIADVIKAAELEHILYKFEFPGNYFDTYFYIKMLMLEYRAWRQGSQELLDYVNEYNSIVSEAYKNNPE